MSCAVGDTLFDQATVLAVHGARRTIAEHELRAAIRLRPERTFEQDPKYPLRLLALSLPIAGPD